MESSLVSAIVANWNGAYHLDVCLPSLLQQSYEPLEIIVVDSGSTDESERVARRWGVGWLPLGRNLGLAGALNCGAEASKGEFLLFLNNDMRFDPNFVQEMVKVIESDGDIFAVDALQYDWDGRQKVHLATFLTKKPRGQLHATQVVPGLWIEQEDMENPAVVFQACAANMMVRKEMFCALNGFDPRMPIGYEDTDLCWRAWLRGWKTVFAPQAICWHRVGAASLSPEGAAVRFKGVLIGRLIVSTKLLPITYVLTTVLRSLGGLVKDLALRREANLRIRCQVMTDYLWVLPFVLQERKEIHRNARVTPNEQLQRLIQLGNR